jgi:hypothetical protein
MPTRSAALLAALEAFDWDAWRAKLRAGVDDVYRDTVDQAGRAVSDAFALDDAFTSAFMTQYIGERIVQLDAFTRENVAALIVRVLDGEGAGSTTALGRLIRDEVRAHVQGYETWRANRIARTESGIAYNHGTTLGWKQAGGTHLNVTDGDRDEPCASANGAVWTIAECLDNALGHPNCTRAFAPRE